MCKMRQSSFLRLRGAHGCVVLIALQLMIFEIFAASRSPNVVFVVFDDLRPAISGYGDTLARTPNIDRFMERSFYFNRAYSQQSLCAPSRNSFLTSRRPDSLHLYDFYNYWRTFRGNFTTLPQYFKSHGYTTHSVGKIFHPGASSNYSDDYPLSWTEPPFHGKSEMYMNSPVCPDGSGRLKRNLVCPVRLSSQPFKTLPDIETVHEAIRFLRSPRNESFFLAVGFHKPHIPLRFPKYFLKHFNRADFANYTNDAYKPCDMPNVAWNPFTDIRKRDDFKNLNISFPFGPLPVNRRAAIRQAYYASVAYVDDLFGRLMKNINLENSVVVVTSDHGWSLGEHAEWAKYSNFEVALRVPLIIAAPQFPLVHAKRLDNIVELVDIFPTIVDLAKLPSVEKCATVDDITCTEGKSLYSLLRTGRDSTLTEVALSQYPRPGPYPTLNPNSDKPRLNQINVMGYSIRTSSFRYTLWVQFNASNFKKDWSHISGEEMYDHRIDHSEDINLSDRPELYDIRMRLRNELKHLFSK